MVKPITPEKTRLGWIGTGVMGQSMCSHLLKAGYRVTVFNRTRAKAEPLLKLGATWAESPRAVAQASEIVFSIVGFPSDVEEVLLGEHGALAGSSPGTVLVDMTTSRPSLAIEIAEQADRRDVISIDAPVSGGDVGAHNGTLSIMIGGDRETVEALAHLLGKHGLDLGLARRPRSRPTHQDGQPNSNRRQHGWSLRSTALCLPSRPRPGERHAVSRLGGRRELVTLEFRTSHHRRKFRPRILRRAFCQRHGHRGWRRPNEWI